MPFFRKDSEERVECWAAGWAFTWQHLFAENDFVLEAVVKYCECDLFTNKF